MLKVPAWRPRVTNVLSLLKPWERFITIGGPDTLSYILNAGDVNESIVTRHLYYFIGPGWFHCDRADNAQLDLPRVRVLGLNSEAFVHSPPS